MSKLAVGSIEGLASEGYKITVPTGSKIVQTGAVLQVVSTTKTDTFSTTSTSFTDVTGLSVSITPSATSSKILVVASLGIISTSGSNTIAFRLMRDATAIYIGDTAGSRSPSSFGGLLTDGFGFVGTANFLDAPSSVASTTYKIQCLSRSTQTVYVNKLKDDTDTAGYPRAASTITVMEIAG